jgi:hypothetical protein
MVYVGYYYDFDTIGYVPDHYWSRKQLQQHVYHPSSVFQVALEHRYEGSGSGTPRF